MANHFLPLDGEPVLSLSKGKLGVKPCAGRVLKKTLFAGCSKTLRYKAPEIPACGRQAEE